LRDYVRKGGFHGVVLGLAEDLASAVVATLAVESLGSERVRAVAMPSDSNGDRPPAYCARLAENLGIDVNVLPINDLLQRTKSVLVETLYVWGEELPGGEIPEGLRAAILSVLAGTGGRVPLVPTSKTDLALGRSVPVGGAVAPVGDLVSRDVVRLAKHLNTSGERIPRGLVEQREAVATSSVVPGQGPLPPDDRLDEILTRRIEQGQTVGDIVAAGLDSQLVHQTLRQFDRAEPWRRQAPTVLQVSDRAFGLGRRIPVARRYP
jgi:NH3-dependent NAD+ synthetase